MIHQTSWIVPVFAVALGGLPQSSGTVRGRVVDDNGVPVEGVGIFLEYRERVTRDRTVTTDEKGGFVQVGLEPGPYQFTLRKEGYQPLVFEERVNLGPPTDLGELVLRKIPEASRPAAAGASVSEAARLFEDALTKAESGDYPAATAGFQRFLELEPDSAEGQFNLAFALMKTGNFDDAARHYEKAVELRSDYREAWVALGDVRSAQREWAKASEAFARAIELGAEEPGTLFNFGAAAMNAGRVALAEGAFTKLLAANPKHAGGHFQLAMVLVGQTRNDEAIAHLERYLELEPEGANAATAKAILEHLKKS